MIAHRDLVAPAPRDRYDLHSTDGTRLNVELYGPEDAPTVVLVHGWSCSIAFWARQLNALQADHRVVAYDQRGHGASGAAGPLGHSAEALADDAATVLDTFAHDGEKVVAVGHSMGAMSLVALAWKHPELLHQRVAAVLLASTGMHDLVPRSKILPLPLPLAKVAKPLSSRVLSLHPPGRTVTPAHRAVVKFASLSASATPAEVDFCARMITACPAATRSGFGQMLSDLNLDDHLADIDVPALMVAGTDDRLTPIWHARRMAAKLPRSLGVIELEGSGHMTPIQGPARVNAAIRQLVADHLTTAPRRLDLTGVDDEQEIAG